MKGSKTFSSVEFPSELCTAKGVLRLHTVQRPAARKRFCIRFSRGVLEELGEEILKTRPPTVTHELYTCVVFLR